MKRLRPRPSESQPQMMANGTAVRVTMASKSDVNWAGFVTPSRSWNARSRKGRVAYSPETFKKRVKNAHPKSPVQSGLRNSRRVRRVCSGAGRLPSPAAAHSVGRSDSTRTRIGGADLTGVGEDQGRQQ